MTTKIRGAEAAPPVGDHEIVGAVRSPLARLDWRGAFARYGLLLALVVLIAVFSLAKPDSFPTVDNAKSILTSMAPLAIIACGLTVVLVMGDFDLSFGSIVGLGGAVAIVLQTRHGMAWQAAIVLALLLAVCAGVINGYLVAYAGLPSFILTLAMSIVLLGVEYVFTDQQTISTGVANGYTELGQSTPLLGLNSQIWVALGVAVALWIVLEKSEIGRYMYAVGGGAEAARLSGVNTRFLRLVGFVVVAIAAAVAGILLTSLSAASTPNMGSPYLLPAFAAVFLGTAVFKPGQFQIAGTIVGALLLSVIQTGLTMLALTTAAINIIEGVILIVAVMSSRFGFR